MGGVAVRPATGGQRCHVSSLTYPATGASDAEGLTGAPEVEKGALDLATFRTGGQGLLAVIEHLVLEVAKHALPQVTVPGPVAPVAVDGGARALALAHDEEPAARAAPVLL